MRDTKFPRCISVTIKIEIADMRAVIPGSLHAGDCAGCCDAGGNRGTALPVAYNAFDDQFRFRHHLEIGSIVSGVNEVAVL